MKNNVARWNSNRTNVLLSVTHAKNRVFAFIFLAAILIPTQAEAALLKFDLLAIGNAPEGESTIIGFIEFDDAIALDTGNSSTNGVTQFGLSVMGGFNDGFTLGLDGGNTVFFWNALSNNLSLGFTLHNETQGVNPISSYEFSISGRDYIWAQPVAHVPTPSTLVMFASGVIGLWGVSRRKQKVAVNQGSLAQA